MSPFTARPRALVAQALHLRHSSLHRNSFWIMTAIIVTSGLGYAYWAAVARIYPAPQVGLTTALVSLMTVTSIVFNLGTAPVLVQRLPSRTSSEQWSRTLSATMIGCVVLGAGAAFVVVLLLPVISQRLAVARHDLLLAALFVVGTSFASLGMVLDYAFIASRRARSMSTRGAVFAFVKIPLVVIPGLALSTGSGVRVIFASWVAALAISCVLALRVMIPRIQPGFRLTLSGTTGELREIARMLAGNHFITLGNYLPIYLLPVIVVSRLSTAANAYFYITWMVGGLFFMISSSAGSSLFAEGSNAPAELNRALRSSARFTALLLAPAMVFVFVAGRLVLELFGSSYAHHGTHLLWVLAVAAIPDAITNLYVPVLRVRDRLRAAACLTMGMSLATLVAAWIVAPTYKLVGIGVVWLGGQALGSLWVAWDMSRERRRASVPVSVDPQPAAAHDVELLELSSERPL